MSFTPKDGDGGKKRKMVVHTIFFILLIIYEKLSMKLQQGAVFVLRWSN